MVGRSFLLAVFVLTPFLGVHAATISWNIRNVQLVDGSGNANNYLAAFFVSAESSDFFGVETISTDQVETLIKKQADLSDYIVETRLTNGSGTITGMSTYSKTNFKNFGAGDTVSAFLALFNASSYDEATYFYLTPVFTVNYKSSTGSQTLAWGDQKSAVWIKIPEPGSCSMFGLFAILIYSKCRRPAKSAA